MNRHEFFILDVFAEERYAGNQLAVFTDGSRFSDDEMQKLAKEMNFSETTFILSPAEGPNTFKVRIFTPGGEVPFAGHPTLGTAYIIAKRFLRDQPTEVVLDLKAGRIPVSIGYDPAGEIERLTMKQLEPRFGPTVDRESAAGILSLPVGEIDERFPVQEVSTGLPFLMIPLKGLSGVVSARLDTGRFERLFSRLEARAVFLFCPETCEEQNQIHARMFAHHLGVPEDPATGSAGGCLVGYLLKHGCFGQPTLDISVEQGYEIGRRSILKLSGAVVDERIEVFVGGRVIPIARGALIREGWDR
ncbi:MAG: PhzF family phenazine biosynthesis protein [Firmicutes bacterium]|nr:PhzF family phenazine biosynthesis protein [Bacillota bacterium]